MSLKHELLQVAAKLQLSTTSFRPANITEWESIMKRIEDRFVQAQYDSLYWWWMHFKDDYCSLHGPEHPFQLLDKLLPSAEKVWFVAEGDGGKFWLFEGTVAAIQQVIAESYAFEYYLVSKQYDWLLCENHHEVLYGVGKQLITQMEQIAESIPATSFYTSTTSPEPK